MSATIEVNRALLDQILADFKEYLATPKAKSLLEKMNAEKQEVRALMERLSKLDRNSPEFVEWVLYGLLPYSKTKHAKRISLFSAFMNIKPFFKRYNYSEEDWKIIANKIFELCLSFQKKPEELNALIQTFSRDRYSKNFQCGSLTPIFFCLNDKYPVINNPVIHAYKAIEKMLGRKGELSQKLRDYPENTAKLDRMVEEIDPDLFEKRDHLDLFCWWYESEVLQPAKQDDPENSEDDEQTGGAEEEKRIKGVNIAAFLDFVELDKAKLSTHRLKNPETVIIRELVSNSEKNKWLLPRFQRYFDWNKKDIRDFIESIFKDNYVGAILLWEVEGEPAVDVMAIKGVERDEEAKTEAVILDGQQRITSLHYAIKTPHFSLRGSSAPVYFYVNLVTLLQREDSEEVVEVHAEKLTRQQSYAKLLFPVYELENYSDWSNGLEDFLEATAPNKKIRDLGRIIRDKLRHVWEGFEIPYVQLPESMDIGQVTDIFEKLNTRGKKLSVFDLLIARLHKYDIDLRKLWDATFEKYPNIVRYYKATEKIPIYILQAISLLYERNSSCKMKDVLNIHENIYGNPSYKLQNHWEESSDYLSRAIARLENLKDGFGVKSEKEIPFDPMIPILAALLKEIDGREKKAECFKKLGMWYWSSVFTNAYSSSVDSQMTADFKEMRSWFSDDSKVPKTVNQMRIELGILHFLDVQKKSSAKYRGVMSLVALEGAKDFDTGLNLENARNNNKDHVFPKTDALPFGQGGHVHSVLNMTWMSDVTNQVIKRAKRPSIYMQEFVEQKYQGKEDEFIKVLATHLINRSAGVRLREDDFEGFLKERENAVLDKIAHLVGLEDSAKKPSLIAPGQPFTSRVIFYDAIRSCDGYIHWMDKYFSQKGLELLAESLDHKRIREIKILTSVDKISSGLRDSFKDFQKEMRNKGIACELRVIADSKLNAQIHDRWILSSSTCFNLPSPDTIARGQFSEVKSTNTRVPFDEWWKASLDVISDWDRIQKLLAEKSSG